MKYPKVYYQVKMLKKIWSKSTDPDREMMLKSFDETLETIESQYPEFNADDAPMLDEFDKVG